MDFKSYRSFEVTWLGLTPLMFGETFSVTMWLLLAMPRPLDSTSPLLQVLLVLLLVLLLLKRSMSKLGVCTMPHTPGASWRPSA